MLPYPAKWGDHIRRIYRLQSTYERKCQARRSPSACGSHFSQDDLGAVECRQAGAPCREALGAAARKQVGSCMTVRFGGQSRMGDSSCSWNLQQQEGLSSFLGISPPGRLAKFQSFPASFRVSRHPESRRDCRELDSGVRDCPGARTRWFRPKARRPAGRALFSTCQ